MPNNEVEYILKARNEASATLANVLHQFQGIEDVLANVRNFSRGAGLLGLSTGLVAGIAGTTAAIVRTGASVADMVEQFDRLSSTTGVSVERLQVIKRVIKDGGGDADSFSKSLVKLNRAMQDGDPLLAKLGVTSDDTFTAFMQLARAITQSTDAKARDEVAFRLLGKAGADLIPDLENLLATFDATYATMQRTGELMGSTLVAEARALDTQMDTLSRNWDAAMQRMRNATVPIASGIVSMFNDIWDAASGVDRNPDVARLKRELAEVAVGIRNALAQQNNPGKVDLLHFENVPLNTLLARQKSLQEQLDRLTGVDSGAARARSLHESGGGPGGDSLANALTQGPSPVRDSNRSARSTRPTFEEFRNARDQASLATFNQLEGTDLTLEEVRNSGKALAEMARSIQQVQVTALQYTQTAKIMAERSDAWREAVNRMRGGVGADFNAMVAEAVRGTDNIRVVWKNLTTSIIADVLENAGRFGIGFGLQLLGLIPGLGFLGGVGSTVTGTGGIGSQGPPSGRGPGVGPMAVAGGDTYYISTMNAKDLVDQMLSPTGEWRRATQRVRDISRAGR